MCQVSGVREVSASVTDELGPCRPGRTDTMIKGFKGFDKDLKCKGFQYEIGGEYEEREAKACQKGFHFCENPLDIFSYYQPADSRFAEVEGDGETDRHNDDSKVACTKIKIGAEIKLPGLIEAGVKFILDRVNWDDKKKSNTGDRSAATVEGKESVAIATGYKSKARGALGCWIVLAEWDEGGDRIKDVQCAMVDGEKIKSDTFYQLVNGVFVEC